MSITFTQMLATIFWLCAVVQFGYICVFFWRVLRIPSNNYAAQGQRNPASIIICARNEAENLKKNLPKILEQKYYGADSRLLYEVIVVENGSTDSSGDELSALQAQYAQLVVVTVPNEGKKNALKAGVAVARHNWLVFTDADCAPASDNWLKMMLRPLAQGKEIVAGYGGFYHSKGLLNAFIRWETLHTFTQYSTYALAGLPYMAVGRNMACTRSMAETAMQHPVWNELPYGDDDLLVNIVGNASNTAVMCLSGSFTYSSAKVSWQEWAKQKQRHLSAGKYYRKPIKWFLSTYGITHAAMWITFFCLASSAVSIWVVLAMAVRCLLYWQVWGYAAAMLNEDDVVIFFPVFDFGWMIYNFAFLPYIAFKNKKNWK